VIFLASGVRPPRGGGDEALLRLAAEAGADGVHFGVGCDLEVHARLAVAALQAGLGVSSLALPLPERPLPAGRRLPRLSAPARDERDAAIALALRGLEAAIPLAARFALLDFGEVTLTTRPGEVARAFARREMDEGEAGATLLSAALAERRARAAQLGDACRWALERLLRGAERSGITLAVSIAASPWQVPSAREAAQLTDAFAGAGLGPMWEPGRLSALVALGLGLSDERLRALADGAVLAVESDAVGIDTGYLPGLGERDPRVAALAAPMSVPRIVSGGPDATDAEVADAIRLTRSRVS